jgi:hypothetical protein
MYKVSLTNASKLCECQDLEGEDEEHELLVFVPVSFRPSCVVCEDVDAIMTERCRVQHDAMIILEVCSACTA